MVLVVLIMIIEKHSPMDKPSLQQKGQSLNQVERKETEPNNDQKNNRIDNEIANLQRYQYQPLDMTNNKNNNKNINNMYLNDNPTLKGYNPANGNHTMRSKLLNRPNSFVSGHYVHEINAFESHMSLPYEQGGGNKNGNHINHNNGNNYNGSHNNYSGRGGQDKGHNNNNNNNNYNRHGRQNNGNNNNYGSYHNLNNIGDGFIQSDRPYDFYENGHLDDGYNDGTFGNTNDARFVNYGGEYGRHQRTYTQVLLLKRRR